LYFPFVNVNSVTQSVQKGKASNALSDLLEYGACVKECPGADLSAPVRCRPPTFMTKNPDKYKDCVYYPLGVISGKGARYETAKFGQFCAPSGESLKEDAVKVFESQFNAYFGKFNVQQYLTDIVHAREVLYWTLLSGFLIGFIYLIFLRLFGGPLVYISILAIILGTAYGGFMVYQSWELMSPTHPHK
jgi:hypothetical protein